jgi:hypothetical protein
MKTLGNFSPERGQLPWDNAGRMPSAWPALQKRRPHSPDSRKKWVEEFMKRVDQNEAAQSLMFEKISKFHLLPNMVITGVDDKYPPLLGPRGSMHDRADGSNIDSMDEKDFGGYKTANANRRLQMQNSPNSSMKNGGQTARIPTTSTFMFRRNIENS